MAPELLELDEELVELEVAPELPFDVPGIVEPDDELVALEEELELPLEEPDVVDPEVLFPEELLELEVDELDRFEGASPLFSKSGLPPQPEITKHTTAITNTCGLLKNENIYTPQTNTK